MSVKLESLVVDLQLNSASIVAGLKSAKDAVGGFASGISSALSGVQDMAKSVKRASNEIAQAGLGLAAVAGGAVALAATVDKSIAAEVKNLKNAFTDLAVPIATMVVPAMRELATMVRTAADYVAGLSPHTRAMISTFLQVAVVVGGAALVISKVAAAVGALAGVFAAITAGPFLLFIGGIAAVAATALFLHKVWRENWGGIQEYTRSVIEQIAGYWRSFKAFLGGIFDGLIDAYGRFYLFAMNATVSLLETIGKVSKAQGDMMREANTMFVNVLTANLKGGGLTSAALELGGRLKDGFLSATGALKKELELILEGFGLNKGKAARHGGTAPSAPTSGMDAIADLSMAAAQAKIDAAASVLADTMAKKAKEAGEFFVHSMRFFTGEIAAEFSAIANALHEAGAAVQAQGQNIASKFGALGAIINAGVQGMASGGPWGAVIGIVIELFSNLATAMKVVGHLMEIFGRGLDRLDKVLGPVFEAFATIADTVEFLTEILEGIFDPLFYIGIILEAVGKTISGTQLALMLLWRLILQATGNNTTELTKQINELEAKQKKWSFDPDPAKNLNDGMKDLAKTVDKVADKFDEMKENIPSGYKLKNAQFGADGSTGGSAPWGLTDQGIGTAWDGTMDFSGVSFDPGALLSSAYDTPFMTADGVLAGNGSTDLGGTGGTFVPGNGGGGWSQQQMQAFLIAYQAAIEAGATDEQAAQAGTLAANNAGQASSSSPATAAANPGGGGGGGGGTTIHSVNLYPRSFSEFAKQITEQQASNTQKAIRNPRRTRGGT